MKRIRTAWLLVGLAGCGCTMFEPPGTLRIPPAPFAPPLCSLPPARLDRPVPLATLSIAPPGGAVQHWPAAALDRPVPAAKAATAPSQDPSAKLSEWASDAG